MKKTDSILYVEDDDNDVFLMQRALKKLALPNALRVVSDGKQAISYLSGDEAAGKTGEAPLGLVLLDLSMPGKHGLDVLQWIRTRPALSKIPVVILTSSNQETDIHRAYLLGANGYLIKPGDPGDLIRIMDNVHRYWLSGAVPPGPFVDVASVPKPPEAKRPAEAKKPAV